VNWIPGEDTFLGTTIDEWENDNEGIGFDEDDD